MHIKPLTPQHIDRFGVSLHKTYQALVTTPKVSLDAMKKTFLLMQEQGIHVLEAFSSDTSQSDCCICGVVSILLEHKLIRGGVIAAHIEDLAVDESFQGQGIGTALLQQAIRYAQENSAYISHFL